MQAMLKSTTKTVEMMTANGATIQARIWEGITNTGIPVHAYIIRIAVPADADQDEFKQELTEHAAPTPAIQAIPLRLVI